MHTTSRWSKSPTSKYVTHFIEGLIHEQYEASKKYDNVRTDENTWYIVHNAPKENISINSGVPKFARVRRVTKDMNDVMICSCCYTKRFMIPCRHILNINQQIFDINDVCVRNSIEYSLKYGDSKYEELTAEYDKKWIYTKDQNII